MSRKTVIAFAVACALVAAAGCNRQSRTAGDAPAATADGSVTATGGRVETGARPSPIVRTDAEQPEHGAHASHVPAHYETAPPLASLAPTLDPGGFTGKTKEAYRVAGKIPRTLAQLPCYCHCDESVGHKSLHSCFADTHAAGCAVCVEEALAADQLQKQGLSAPQIRDRIVAEFSQL